MNGNNQYSPFLQAFFGQLDTLNKEKESKAKNMLSALEYFGGTPTEDQAVELKNTLGFDWPVQKPGGVQHFSEVPNLQTNIEPAYVSGDRSVKPTYKPMLGKEPLEQMKILAKVKTEEKKPTISNVIAGIMEKKNKNEELTPGEEEVFKVYQSGKNPWFTNLLGEEELNSAARTATGLDMNAYQRESHKLNEDKFTYQQEHDAKVDKFKLMAHNQIMELKKKGLISIDDFRKKLIKLNSTAQVVKNMNMNALLNGDELPDLDYETLFGVSLPKETPASTPGQTPVTPPKPGAPKPVVKSAPKTPEQKKAIVDQIRRNPDKINQLLDGYDKDTRIELFNIYTGS